MVYDTFIKVERVMDKEKFVLDVLHDLPEWFGIESAVKEYAENSVNLPFFFIEDKGFLTLRQTSPYTAEIYVMGVKKQFQHCKIGTQLFNMAYSYCVGKYDFLQVKTVKMGMYEEYDRTNLFYKSLGFKELEVLDLWDERNPCQVYIMKVDDNEKRAV